MMVMPDNRTISPGDRIEKSSESIPLLGYRVVTIRTPLGIDDVRRALSNDIGVDSPWIWRNIVPRWRRGDARFEGKLDQRGFRLLYRPLLRSRRFVRVRGELHAGEASSTITLRMGGIASGIIAVLLLFAFATGLILLAMENIRAGRQPVPLYFLTIVLVMAGINIVAYTRARRAAIGAIVDDIERWESMAHY
jgi:hypothetical protein